MVNRGFSPENAGNYATLVLFRRIFAVLPSVALIILYPKIVALTTAQQKPDKPIIQTTILIIVVNLALATPFFLFGNQILTLTVGEKYLTIAPLLGWMGLATTGFSLTALWMNVFLATKPQPFLIWLATLMTLFYLLITQAKTLQNMTLIFGITGWLGAFGGLLLYIIWLRPKIGR